jgi:hypothetical protein
MAAAAVSAPVDAGPGEAPAIPVKRRQPGVATDATRGRTTKPEVWSAVRLVRQEKKPVGVPLAELNQQLARQGKKPTSRRVLNRALAQASADEAVERQGNTVELVNRRWFVVHGTALFVGDKGLERRGGKKRLSPKPPKEGAPSAPAPAPAAAAAAAAPGAGAAGAPAPAFLPAPAAAEGAQENHSDFTRSRFDAEEKRDHAKEGKYHQGLFASAFKMACETVVAARESGGNKGAKQCCRDAEKKYGLPVNTLKYARINAYVRNPAPEGFVPMARGPNAPDSLVNAILDAVASDIQITTLKGDPINPDDVKDKLQDIFRLAGLPYKSNDNLWNKLRARHPDALRSWRSTAPSTFACCGQQRTT